MGPKMINLDTALNPSLLTKSVKSEGTVGAIGSSHSAILVLMNLYALTKITHPHLRIKWFTRCKDLRYAKCMDGPRILNEDVFDKSPVSKIVNKFWTTPDVKEERYQAELPGCTYVIQAIGYKRHTLPNLGITASTGAKTEPLNVQHDNLTGPFFYHAGG